MTIRRYATLLAAGAVTGLLAGWWWRASRIQDEDCGTCARRV